MAQVTVTNMGLFITRTGFGGVLKNNYTREPWGVGVVLIQDSIVRWQDMSLTLSSCHIPLISKP